MGTPVIGFDFDECLAEAYTLVPFIVFCETLLPHAVRQEGVSQMTRDSLLKAKEAFYHRIAALEAHTKGTFLRPSFLRLMPKLLSLRQQGRLRTLFIYSNNGTKAVLEAVDHILALTLQMAPYNVAIGQLIQDSDSRIHCLSPRIHLDEPCRAVEPKESNGFREKSIEGIAACLDMGVTESSVWFFDDSSQHDKLMKSLGSQYVHVKPYSIKLPNKKLAEMFVQSFPEAAFQPATREGVSVLPALQSLFPGFRLTGRESVKVRADKLTREANKFSPLGGGRTQKLWSEKELRTDLQQLETGIAGAISATQVPADVETAVAYRVPIGGGHSGRSMKTRSRSRKNRGLRTLRKRRL